MNAYGRHVLASFLCVLLAACTQTQPAPDAVPRGTPPRQPCRAGAGRARRSRKPS